MSLSSIHRHPVVLLALMFGGILAVIGVVVLLAVGSFDRQQDTTSPESIATPESSATSPASEPEVVSLETLDIDTRTRIEQAVLLYASYPQSSGKATILTQLESFVTEEALAAIAASWEGPEITTVNATVTEVVLEPEMVTGDLPGSLRVTANVTQAVDYTNTPSAIFFPIISVSLVNDEGKWSIVRIEEVGA
ncbi:MAG TPA: hypothetical protein VNI82_00400 [Candidatus Nitrosotenuis sp.]|nr:hypothetical protein [Candidatus Nitrosotenuis sp.]